MLKRQLTVYNLPDNFVRHCESCRRVYRRDFVGGLFEWLGETVPIETAARCWFWRGCNCGAAMLEEKIWRLKSFGCQGLSYLIIFVSLSGVQSANSVDGIHFRQGMPAERQHLLHLAPSIGT